MGQTSLQILNRAGSKSFWNSSWDNKYLYQDFFFKFLIFEKIIHTIVNKKSYSSAILGLTFKTKNNIYIFKNLKNKITLSDDDIEEYNEEICKSKLWVFKYHNWVVLSIFILMPYKHHKLVKKNLIPFEYQIKKKQFNFLAFNFKNKKTRNSHKLRRSKASAKLKRKSTIKSTRYKKTKLNRKKRKHKRFNKFTNFHIMSFKKNIKFLKTNFKIPKKLIIKKLTPFFYLKKLSKQIASANRKKIKDSHDLTKGWQKINKKKPEKTNYKAKISTAKLMLSAKVFFKSKLNSASLAKYIKSFMSIHAGFLKKFILLRSDLAHRLQKRFSSNIKPRLKKKIFKQIVFIKTSTRTYKALLRKNDRCGIDFFKKQIFFKKKILKKQINFFKTNKKTNKKTIFEKSSFFKLSINLNTHRLSVKPKHIILKKTKNKRNFIKIYKNFEKKKIKFKESKALITEMMGSLKNSYDYL